jgi:Protein of unknown function (DUF1573)
MKKIFTILGIVVLFAAMSCSQTSQKRSAKNLSAKIEFETTEHDYGTLPYKADGTFEFVFKNTGKEPLVLKNVRSSCGCTVPEWPKDPIKKGEMGKIKVRYNTGITGNFSKSISVFSNATEKPVILVIKGKVEAAAKEISATSGEGK